MRISLSFPLFPLKTDPSKFHGRGAIFLTSRSPPHAYVRILQFCNSVVEVYCSGTFDVP